VFAFRDQAVGRNARLLATMLLGAVGLVLLIGCANLASLLLARGSARQREMAVRTALGARRGHLVRHLLAEALLLAALGGALGVLLGVWGLELVVASFPEDLPYWIRLDLDGRVLAFTALVSLLTAMAFGLAPALRASRPDVVAELKEGGRSGGSRAHGRFQRALVVGQVALCLGLLMGAQLLVRSFLNLQDARSGFEEDHLLTLRLYLAGDAYDPIEAKSAFLRRAAERLRSLPGVRAAAATTTIPTDDGGGPARAVADGQPVAPGEETGVSIIGITPGLFDALGTAAPEGRDFTEDDNAPERARVAIVNRGLARRFWPAGGAVGSRIGLLEGGQTAWLTVVGIAPDVQYEEFGEESPQSRLNVYVPYGRLGYRTMAFLVRTEGRPSALASSVRQALRGLDAGLPTYDVRTMREVRRYTTWEQRFFGEAMGAFAAAALLLACLGVYGLLAHTVGQRVHEMGIRLALGARPMDVVRQVLGEGLAVAGLGILLGLLLAGAVARVLAGAIYGVAAAEPWSFAGIAAALAGVVLAASYLPARRAGRTDPMTALRCE
jgi:putative ABC transport system permease protein